VISFPARVPAGSIVTEPVSLAELPATIVDLLRIGGESPLPGNSLASCWSQPREQSIKAAPPILTETIQAADLPASYPASKGNMESLVVGSYQYIRNGDGGEELYDLAADKAELKNLAESSRSRPVLDILRSLTTALMYVHQ
jgi:hypothetical protein